MAEIYSIPDSGSGTPQFTIPIGGMGNGGMFGNGMNGIADLFGLAIIASMFGWGNGGWGNGFGGGNNGACKRLRSRSHHAGHHQQWRGAAHGHQQLEQHDWTGF